MLFCINSAFLRVIKITIRHALGEKFLNLDKKIFIWGRYGFDGAIEVTVLRVPAMFRVINDQTIYMLTM